jgi:hypothetical protein
MNHFYVLCLRFTHHTETLDVVLEEKLHAVNQGAAVAIALQRAWESAAPIESTPPDDLLVICVEESKAAGLAATEIARRAQERLERSRVH